MHPTPVEPVSAELHLEVRKDGVRTARVTRRPLQPLERGEVLFEVERFALTANNITYALLGERLGYWNLFPAPGGWGQVPVWAYLRVLASRAGGIEPGQRAYGFCPPSSHVILSPERVSSVGFLDATPHRRQLDVVYNSYSWLETDEAYDPALADQLLVLRPLFWLSFMLDDHLSEQRLLEGHTVLLTSASSKAAIGAAHLLAARGVSTIGLTSAANLGFVASLGVYERIVAYEQIGELPRSPAVLLDLAGSNSVRNDVAAHFGGLLAQTVVAGATHLDAAGADVTADDRRTIFLFAPERIRRRAKQIGWLELNGRYCEALHRFAADAKRWLKVDRRHGPAALEAAYLATLDNVTAPDRAQLLSLAEADAAGPTRPCADATPVVGGGA